MPNVVTIKAVAIYEKRGKSSGKVYYNIKTDKGGYLSCFDKRLKGIRSATIVAEAYKNDRGYWNISKIHELKDVVKGETSPPRRSIPVNGADHRDSSMAIAYAKDFACSCIEAKLYKDVGTAVDEMFILAARIYDWIISPKKTKAPAPKGVTAEEEKAIEKTKETFDAEIVDDTDDVPF